MARPNEGTPEWELWITAIDIASTAPLTHGPNTFAAQIPWRQVERLRSALDDLGVDWEKVKRTCG